MYGRKVENSHLSKLALSQLLLKCEQCSRELLHNDVLPGQQVHCQRGDGVRVASGDTLQVDDVCLCVVGGAILHHSLSCGL